MVIASRRPSSGGSAIGSLPSGAPLFSVVCGCFQQRPWHWFVSLHEVLHMGYKGEFTHCLLLPDDTELGHHLVHFPRVFFHVDPCQEHL